MTDDYSSDMRGGGQVSQRVLGTTHIDDYVIKLCRLSYQERGSAHDNHSLTPTPLKS